MKTVNVREARETFADLITQAQAEPVVLTKHGKPVGVLLGAAEAEKRMALSAKSRKARVLKAGVLLGVIGLLASRPALADDPPLTDDEITELCKGAIALYQQSGQDAAAREMWQQCWSGHMAIREARVRKAAAAAAEEAERSRVAQEKAAALLLATKRADDPAWFVPVLSARICDARADQKVAKASIAGHKSLARKSGGGVIDLQQIDSWQSDFRMAADRETSARTALKVRGKAPLGCTAGTVAPLVGCTNLDAVTFGGDDYAQCREPARQAFLDVLRAL